MSSRDLGAWRTAGALLTCFAVVPLGAPAQAHCDTLGGPVASTALRALQTGDVTPILKWVKPAQELEVQSAFRRARAARRQGVAAREVADTYFLETVVRLHRAGEGAPYTGLKPAGSIDRPVLAADAALQRGSVDPLVRETTDEIAAGIRRRYARVVAARRRAETSTAAGRAYVAAYIEYTHYIEKLHAAGRGGDHHDADE